MFENFYFSTCDVCFFEKDTREPKVNLDKGRGSKITHIILIVCFSFQDMKFQAKTVAHFHRFLYPNMATSFSSMRTDSGLTDERTATKKISSTFRLKMGTTSFFNVRVKYSFLSGEDGNRCERKPNRYFFTLFKIKMKQQECFEKAILFRMTTHNQSFRAMLYTV